MLDRPTARPRALVVLPPCTGAPAWLHWADPSPETVAPEPDPFAPCVADQWAQIEPRAEAKCQAEHPEP